MNKFYLLAVKGLNRNQEVKLAKLFNEQKIAWWKNFADLWMVHIIVKNDNDFLQEDLMDIVQSLYPNNEFLIFDVSKSKDWIGFGTDDMFEWMESAVS